MIARSRQFYILELSVCPGAISKHDIYVLPNLASVHATLQTDLMDDADSAMHGEEIWLYKCETVLNYHYNGRVVNKWNLLPTVTYHIRSRSFRIDSRGIKCGKNERAEICAYVSKKTLRAMAFEDIPLPIGVTINLSSVSRSLNPFDKFAPDDSFIINVDGRQYDLRPGLN